MLVNLHSSQNIHHKLHQSALANIDGRLRVIQGQLSVHPGRASGSRHKGGIAGNRVISGRCHAAVVTRRAQHFSLPFWKVVTTYMYNSIAAEKRSHNHRARYILAFIPPPWLSYVVLQWELQMCRTIGGGLPGINLSLTPISYNPNPELKAAITNFDIAALQGLFREGVARPTDYVLLRKPMSLLEVGFRLHVIYHPQGPF
jgi:hypothetical protein